MHIWRHTYIDSITVPTIGLSALGKYLMIYHIDSTERISTRKKIRCLICPFCIKHTCLCDMWLLLLRHQLLFSLTRKLKHYCFKPRFVIWLRPLKQKENMILIQTWIQYDEINHLKAIEFTAYNLFTVLRIILSTYNNIFVFSHDRNPYFSV